MGISRPSSPPAVSNSSSGRHFRKAAYIPSGGGDLSNNVVPQSTIVEMVAVSQVPVTSVNDNQTIKIPISPTTTITMQTDRTTSLTLHHSQTRVINLLSSGHDVQVHYNMTQQTCSYSTESPTARTKRGDCVISCEDQSVIYQPSGIKQKIILRRGGGSPESHLYCIRGYFVGYGHISASIDGASAIKQYSAARDYLDENKYVNSVVKVRLTIPNLKTNKCLANFDNIRAGDEGVIDISLVKPGVLKSSLTRGYKPMVQFVICDGSGVPVISWQEFSGDDN